MSEKVITDLLSVLVPDSLSSFVLSGVTEYKDRIEFRMDEKETNIPSHLQNKGKVVLDGFCNPIELQSFPLKGKPVFYKVYRRRWKLGGTSQSSCNDHNLHPDGVKATQEFASFLKEEVGQTLGEYNALWGFIVD
ncbi:hypothetical protein LJB78_01440 [Bacteroidales bacterium OttesenSCG-928-J16]|nr:hypothetical protein [Bacteroidales bacterium OttesenSCG-928-J16]